MTAFNILVQWVRGLCAGQSHFDKSKKGPGMMWSFSVRGWLHGQFSRSLVDRSVCQSARPENRARQASRVHGCDSHSHCAVICGSDSWVDVELFGKSKKAWLSRMLNLPNGIPSHDTFGRIFAMLDPVQFESCFMEWVEAVNEVVAGQVVAIDGKTIRRSHDRQAGKSAVHMVSAWASPNHLVLGQLRVNEQSNEITAIPELLGALDVSGCTVTIDAIGCQKEIAATVTDRGADYVLALKQNQPQLYDDVTEMFDHARRAGFSDLPHHFSETVGKGHGRIEKRRC